MISEWGEKMPLKAWNYVPIRERVYSGTFAHVLVNGDFSSFLYRAGVEFGQHFKNTIFFASKLFLFQNMDSIMLSGKDKLEYYFFLSLLCY